MQIVSRPFFSKPAIDDDDEPILIHPSKPQIIIPALVLVTSIAVGWACAWGTHELILWLRNPPPIPEEASYFGHCIRQAAIFIHNALYH